MWGHVNLLVGSDDVPRGSQTPIWIFDVCAIVGEVHDSAAADGHLEDPTSLEYRLGLAQEKKKKSGS